MLPSGSCEPDASRVTARGATPLAGFGAIVIAVDLHGLVSGRSRVGSSPSCPDIQCFAAENAVNVGLRRGAVDVALGPPVIFGNRDRRAGVVIGIGPIPQARDQLH